MTQEQSISTAEACYQHPNLQTRLRCNRCNAYICVKCARRTAVGYKCPTCVRRMQNNFFNGTWWDYGIATLIATPLSLLAAFAFTYVIGRIGWFSWYIAVVAAPVTAGIISEAVQWGVGKRRSRYLTRVVAGCFIIGTVLVMLLVFVTSSWWSDFLGSIYLLVGPGILLFVGTSVIVARLR